MKRPSKISHQDLDSWQDKYWPKNDHQHQDLGEYHTPQTGQCREYHKLNTWKPSDS